MHYIKWVINGNSHLHVLDNMMEISTEMRPNAVKTYPRELTHNSGHTV